MQLVRKISAKTMGWSKEIIQEQVILKKNDAILLYRVVGIATSTRSGKSKFDDRDEAQDWLALLGNFEGTSSLTGEVFRAGVCFMPNYVCDLVAGQLDSGDEHASVRFAYDIYAKWDKQSATSYVFFAEPLMEPPADDPLKSLSAAMPAMKGLPTPEKQAQLNAPASAETTVADKPAKK
jgi:hypothetical protein